jgi:deoxyribose-phosphate aldolase
MEFMTPTDENTRPALVAYEDLAGMVDYTVVAPELSEDHTARACGDAKRLRPARMIVRPSDLDSVTRWLGGTGIGVGAVVSYPNGADTTPVKLYAVRDALGRGAKAIETVLSPARMISRQFRYLESELLQMSQECHRAAAELILDLELAYLSEDLRAIACRLAKRVEVDWVRAGSLNAPGEVTLEDARWLTVKMGDRVKVSGPWPATVEAALEAHAAGIAGFQSTDPRPLLTAWTAELKRREEVSAAAAAVATPSGA